MVGVGIFRLVSFLMECSCMAEQDGNPNITSQQTFVVAHERVQTHVEQDQAASSLRSNQCHL